MNEIARGPIKIFGDSRSGNCLKVRWTADRIGVPFEWVEIDIFRGDTRTDEFLAVNPSGQVPCILLSDGRSLAQSNAIALFLADGGDLVPSDRFERAKLMEWLFWEQYSHEPYIAVRRARKRFQALDEDQIDPQLMVLGRRALGRMEMQLLNSDYFLGSTLTLADIVLVAYTRVAHEGGFDLEEFPGVRSWVLRVERELGLEHALEPAISH